MTDHFELPLREPIAELPHGQSQPVSGRAEGEGLRSFICGGRVHSGDEPPTLLWPPPRGPLPLFIFIVVLIIALLLFSIISLIFSWRVSTK